MAALSSGLRAGAARLLATAARRPPAPCVARSCAVGCRALRCSAAARADAAAPAGEGELQALKRLVGRSREAAAPPEEFFADPEVTSFLRDFGVGCDKLSPEGVREAMVCLAQAQHMPPALWDGGLADEVPRALEELPDLHVVHIGLLMAALDLRRPATLVQELAEQLEIRAHCMSPTGLAGAVIALSQLGPWSTPPEVGGTLEALVESVERLSSRELSAAALATATLAVGGQPYWQRIHGELLARASGLEPKHLADTLLALATTRLCPINLLVALQDRLPHLLGAMEAPEALTSLWAMCALRLFPAVPVARLLERASEAELAPAEARQLRQALLSLDLEPGAKAARLEVSPALRAQAERAAAAADFCARDECQDEAVAEEIFALLLEEGAAPALTEPALDLYAVDVALGQARRGVVVDSASAAEAEAPRDPWTTLKLRHLEHDGWSIAWLPARRWQSWDEEQRRDFVRRAVSKES